jgi:hypothetical protein
MSTFDGSYAAVPHLVAVAAARPPIERPAVLHLAGSIFAYQERGPAVPADLLQAYRASQERAASAIEEVLRGATPTRLDEALALVADLAACRGALALARAIMCIRSGEVDIQCGCGRREILGVSDAGIEISPLRWKRRPIARSLDAVTAHLSGLAESVGLAACACVVADMAASIECPGCGGTLEVLAGIGAANP